MRYIRMFLLLCFVLGCLDSAVAEERKDVMVFIGSLNVKGGGSFTYKLVVNDSGNILKGYTVTDVKGKYETQSALSGLIDYKEKKVTFRETRVIHSRAGNKTDFCFVHAILKMKESSAGVVLTGKFKGYRADGKTICATGNVRLFNAKDLLAKLQEIAGKREDEDTLTSDFGQPFESKDTAIHQKLSLKGNDTAILILEGRDIQISFWDNKDVDGDRISLVTNEETLLKDFAITEKKEVINYHFDQNEINIRLLSTSEGMYSPNTSFLEITDGINDYQIDATTSGNKPIIFKLIKK